MNRRPDRTWIDRALNTFTWAVIALTAAVVTAHFFYGTPTQ